MAAGNSYGPTHFVESVNSGKLGGPKWTGPKSIHVIIFFNLCTFLPTTKPWGNRLELSGTSVTMITTSTINSIATTNRDQRGSQLQGFHAI